MNVCKIDGCESRVYGHGWCNAHWSRWRRHGDPLAGKISHGVAQTTFLTVLHAETDECLIWPHAKSRKGYGMVRFGSTSMRQVHVLVCERHHGPKPTPLHQAAHSCGNAACGNWRHVRWATPKENMADQLLHGTQPLGERHHGAKLTAAQVREIRARATSAQHELLAREFGISSTNLRHIIARRTWSWLDVAA